jgi:hypothetical protein
MSDPDAQVELNEYMVACYGTTEYAEDMTSLTLGCRKDNEDLQIAYGYKCREEELDGVERSMLWRYLLTPASFLYLKKQR